MDSVRVFRMSVLAALVVCAAGSVSWAQDLGATAPTPDSDVPRVGDPLPPLVGEPLPPPVGDPPPLPDGDPLPPLVGDPLPPPAGDPLPPPDGDPFRRQQSTMTRTGPGNYTRDMTVELPHDRTMRHTVTRTTDGNTRTMERTFAGPNGQTRNWQRTWTVGNGQPGDATVPDGTPTLPPPTPTQPAPAQPAPQQQSSISSFLDTVFGGGETLRGPAAGGLHRGRAAAGANRPSGFTMGATAGGRWGSSARGHGQGLSKQPPGHARATVQRQRAHQQQHGHAPSSPPRGPSFKPHPGKSR